MKEKKNPRKPFKSPLSRINNPANPDTGKQNYERIACVFQGGGALGAYQVGAYQAILEKGYVPDFLAGVSIGAINSSIIAGNPYEKQMEKLHGFWDTISPKLWVDIFTPYNQFENTHHAHNQWGASHSLFFGLNGFFTPRLIPPGFIEKDTPDNLSYYDTSELRNTLEKFIDFDRINDKKLVLNLGAVHVTSGEMVFFNNQVDTITPEHIMASCALPPGFPAVKIGEEYYWDGGLYANTPLVTVLDALPEKNTLCFVVDCFSLKGLLPQNMDQVEERQKDIRYGSHSRRLTNAYTSRQTLQAAIAFLGEKLSPELQNDPAIQKILELGHEKRFSVVHIIYNGTPFSHSFKDYNFVRSEIKVRMDTGYENAVKVLANPNWEARSDKRLAGSIYGVDSECFE